MADICNEVYDRILPGDKLPTHVLCTYVEGHRSRHSWETLRVVDEAEAQETHRSVEDALESGLPLEIRGVVLGLTEGKYDEYLELILAAGHDRKRARRGVLGFPRR